MRFDDTNPAKEDMEYINSIKEDVSWILSGTTADPAAAPWTGPVRHSSDYFEVRVLSSGLLARNALWYASMITAAQPFSFAAAPARCSSRLP